VVFGNRTISLHNLERSSRRGCHIRITCHYEPYYLAFDYSAPGSCLSNEGLTDVLDHGSHGNDCNVRSQTQRAQTHFLIDFWFLKRTVLTRKPLEL